MQNTNIVDIIRSFFTSGFSSAHVEQYGDGFEPGKTGRCEKETKDWSVLTLFGIREKETALGFWDSVIAAYISVLELKYFQVLIGLRSLEKLDLASSWMRGHQEISGL